MVGIERKGQQLGSIRVASVEEGTDLSKLRKPELVKLAEDAGIDTEGKKVADLVADLEALQPETEG
jgi:hypothetical protein